MNRETEHWKGRLASDKVITGADSNPFYPENTGRKLQMLIGEYEAARRQPVEVSFRDLVPWVYGGNRATHYLHSYPAKLLPQIAHFFLANERLCPADGVVLDPFSGSGTVALEATLSGRDSYFCDVNPFARLLTRVKTTAITILEVEAAKEKIKAHYDTNATSNPPDVVNLHYWYNTQTAGHLSRLIAAIEMVCHRPSREFFSICFSTVARQLSRANPRFSVPVRLKIDGELVDVSASAETVWAKFEKAVEKAARQVNCLQDCQLGKSTEVADNVLSLEQSWPKVDHSYGEVDLVITSPPYGGAQKYVRATSLSLGWLKQAASRDLRGIEKLTIGREHLSIDLKNDLKSTAIEEANQFINVVAEENRSRAAIASVFLNEMNVASQKIMGSLKVGGYAVVVMADNTVCGRKFETTKFTSKLFEMAGGTKVLELRDRIVSRSLLMKRASSATSISHETITVFRKDGLR